MPPSEQRMWAVLVLLTLLVIATLLGASRFFAWGMLALAIAAVLNAMYAAHKRKGNQ